MSYSLTITFIKNNKNIAAIHYDKANSTAALIETQKIIEKFTTKYQNIEDLQLRLIKICESMGGGVKPTTYEKLKNRYPFRQIIELDALVNFRVISIDNNDIEEEIQTSELLLFVDLDRKKIKSYIFIRNFEKPVGKRIYIRDYNLDIFDFDKLDEIIFDVSAASRSKAVIKTNNIYFELI